MLVAAFETSTRSPSVAVLAGDERFEEQLSGLRPHASDLLPALDRLLAQAGRHVRDLELIVVGTGPGSFTGLRVAASTAMGLAKGGQARLFGLPSLEALCWRELAPGEQAAVLLDARQGQLYFAHYRRLLQDIEVLQAPCLVRANEVPRIPAARWFGDADTARAAALDDLARWQICIDRVPLASALLELGRVRFAREGAHSLQQLEPLYLRAFGAHPVPRAPSAQTSDTILPG